MIVTRTGAIQYTMFEVIQVIEFNIREFTGILLHY